MDRTYNGYRKLRIVLKQEGKTYVFRRPLSEKLETDASHAVYDAWDKHYTDVVDVHGIILATMNSDLREQYETMESPEKIITSLRDRSQEQTQVEKYDSVKSLIRCRLQEGNPVCHHINVIIGYTKYLDEMDCPVGDKMDCLPRSLIVGKKSRKSSLVTTVTVFVTTVTERPYILNYKACS